MAKHDDAEALEKQLKGAHMGSQIVIELDDRDVVVDVVQVRSKEIEPEEEEEEADKEPADQ
jgi:hypothetical protein